ncbi:hypothetical protein [Lachnoclostridium sp. An181]|uniref:hypothetical protein n=1 Tax=Lachnoclostridium sp. An181 TaxID=1965575 RepID=UPI000B3A4F7B|nr:hypothetical protein [Lachnoclostridium sp. An181]OUP49262.1 hypothetical protein B5F18_08460 [Lachnoclostridium sp. An181]
MSNFSETCQKYLHDTGMTKYQFSNTFNLNQTSLQRMLSGTRLPKPDFFAKFCSHLRISPTEKAQLMELYEQERIGKTAYYNRKYIQLILEQFASSNANNNFSIPLANENLHLLSENAASAIHNFLEELINNSNEIPFLYTNLPPDCLGFCRILLKLAEKYHKQFNVYHLFPICQNPAVCDNVNSNLETLLCVISFALTQYEHYHPAFFYCKDSQLQLCGLLYPYYIISKDCVFLLSADFYDFQILYEPCTIAKYHEEFKKYFHMADPFLFVAKTPTEVINFYSQLAKEKQPCSFILESQPCPHSLIYDLDIFKAAAPDTYTSSLETLMHDFREHYHLPVSFHNYFTLDGLLHFVNTGKLSGPYSYLSAFFPVETRKRMLQHFLDVSFKKNRYTMLKNQPLIAKNVYYEVFSDYSFFLCFLNKDQTFLGFYISESSIGESFYDYMESLENSSLAYSHEETRQRIMDLLKTLD